MAPAARMAIFKMYHKKSFVEEAGFILSLRKGDRSAFPAIVARWQDMIYNTALGIVQNEQDAEEVTQDVFVAVFQSLDDFREESKLSTWLYRITVTKALDYLKSRERQKRGGFLKRIFIGDVENEELSFQHPGIALDNKENARVLFAAVARLPEKQKLAFLLHKLEDLGHVQIADIMECSVEAVESLQARAKSRLKELLKEYYENHFK